MSPVGLIRTISPLTISAFPRLGSRYKSSMVAWVLVDILKPHWSNLIIRTVKWGAIDYLAAWQIITLLSSIYGEKVIFSGSLPIFPGTAVNNLRRGAFYGWRQPEGGRRASRCHASQTQDF